MSTSLTNSQNSLTSLFWKYASNLNGEYSLEDAFVKWASERNMRVNDLQTIWKSVNDDVFEAFGISKTAKSMTIELEDGTVLKGDPATLLQFKREQEELQHPKEKESPKKEEGIGGTVPKVTTPEDKAKEEVEKAETLKMHTPEASPVVEAENSITRSDEQAVDKMLTATPTDDTIMGGLLK